MGIQISKYLIRRGDDIGDPETLNKRWRDIDARIAGLEDVRKDWTSALDQVLQTGVAKVNEVLFPAYQRIVELGNLGAIFTAHSATEIEISTGLKRLVVDEDERDAFAPAAFVSAMVVDDKSLAIMGEVQDYNRDTGELSILVLRTAGSGNGAGWIISAASDTDNAEAAELAELYKQNAESARDAALSAETTTLEARDDTLAAREEASARRDEAIEARNVAVDAKDTVLANLETLDRYYLGSHPTDPATDNQGGDLLEGAQYFNSTAKEMRVYRGIVDGWGAEYLPADSTVASVFGRTGAVGAADGDYSAGQIVFTPAGGLTSTRVQAALAELGTNKAAKATTLAGYGITDAYTKTAADALLAAKANAATTLAGYGIADAYTKGQVDTAVAAKVNTTDIVDNLTSTATNKPLSAAQGKALRDMISGLGDTHVVADMTEAATLTGLSKGDIVHVTDNGSGKWIRYQVTNAGDGTWLGVTKIVYWTQDQAPATHTHLIADITGLQAALDLKAPLASPALTGTPTAPTAAADTNTTQLATTQFVLGQAGTSSPAMNGTAATGTSTKFARDDHVHPADTSRAPTSRTISAGGLASGGGDLSANRTISVAAAAAADYRGKSDNSKALTAAGAWGAMAIVTLTAGATVTPDFATGIDFDLTLNQNITLATPSNLVAGQRGRIRLIQDGTGSRTLSFGSGWDFAGGSVPTLSTAAGTIDVLDYDVVSAAKVRAVLSKAWS